jgi:hypothetical protein
VVSQISLYFVSGIDSELTLVNKIGEWSSRSYSLGWLLETKGRKEGDDGR